jgi:glycosyltransferase involved in cell wall biosynthesis
MKGHKKVFALKKVVVKYPKVSLGVCVRNCEKTISQTIESIIAQDFPHELVEIIIVDDGSADNTLSIINSYVSKINMKVKVFHGRWKGLGPSRNLVMKESEGKYIIWVDGDMTLTKDFIRKQVEFMEQHPEAGIGKGRYGTSLREKLVSDLENLEFVTATCRREYALNAPGTGGAVYRVDALKEVGGFDEEITGAGEDTDVEYRIRKAGWSILVTPAIFYERHKETWGELWNQYVWRGSGAFHLFKKRAVVTREMLWPPILTEIKRAITAYKITYRKVAFLLPFHYLFKRIAWFFGFLREYYRNKMILSN